MNAGMENLSVRSQGLTLVYYHEYTCKFCDTMIMGSLFPGVSSDFKETHYPTRIVPTPQSEHCKIFLDVLTIGIVTA